ncbi:MAG: helix-turn-helix domain-containing protein [Bacilli bacterium]
MTNKNIYLSSNLKFLRNVKGKTQQEVAKYCDKTNTAISNWEKGIREPDALDLAKLSNFFDIQIDDLMLKDLRKAEMTDEEETKWYESLENQNVKIVFDKLHEKKNLTHEQAQYINKIIDAIVDEEDNNS